MKKYSLNKTKTTKIDEKAVSPLTYMSDTSYKMDALIEAQIKKEAESYICQTKKTPIKKVSTPIRTRDNAQQEKNRITRMKKKAARIQAQGVESSP